MTLLERLPHPLPQAAALLADPLTLHEERRLAKGMRRLITLTRLGGDCLRQRMGLRPQQVAVIAHGNLPIAPQALPPLAPLRLLYFGFIYRGKGIEDLLLAWPNHWPPTRNAEARYADPGRWHRAGNDL